MPPAKHGFPRSESAFEHNLTKADRDALLQLQSLRQLPKARYATESCLTGLPSGRGRKVVYSHIEIYKMVEDIATDLRGAGVRPQAVCAFVLHNCIEAIVYFLALQWIGAVAVPLDPALSEKDLEVALRETESMNLVSSLVDEDDEEGDETHQKMLRVCSSTKVIHWYISRSTNKGVFLDRKGLRGGEGAAWAGGAGDFKLDPSETSVRMAVQKDGHCLVQDISHRAVASATRTYSSTYQLGAHMSTLLIFPFHNINGLMSVLATMHSGGSVVLAEGATVEPAAIAKHTVDQKITWFSAHPDVVTAVFNDAKAKKDAGFVSLSFIQSIGNGISPSIISEMEPVFRAQVLEAYGSPETCGLITTNRDHDLRLETFGSEVHGCEVAIFGKDSQKLPAETIGDIGVYGLHVIGGYRNNDEANDKYFVVAEEGGDRKQYFLTGDQGSLSSDGFLKLKVHCRLPPTLATKGSGEISPRSIAEEEKEKEEEAVRRKDEEDAQRMLLMKLEDDKRRLAQEEEEERIREEQRKADEEKLADESDHSEDSDDEIIDTSSAASTDSDELSFSRNKTATSIATGSASVSQKSRAADKHADDETLGKIMERLDRIETNQTRLETEIEASHRLEMQRLRELIEKTEAERLFASAQQVDMEAIKAALSEAAASAQSSSQNTAAAAQAAKEAAEAAALAAASRQAAKDGSRSVVEVRDPDALQKTVLVSLDEVEDAMKKHASVACARAFGRPDLMYGTEVFCAVRPMKGARVSEAWLKLHAQTVLPAACVPKKFFYKEDLRDGEDRGALTQNMKLAGMAEYAGLKSGPKVVRGPSWAPSKTKAGSSSK